MRPVWLIAVVVLAGCVQSASVVCGDGTVCPEGATCDLALGRCITGAQTAACEALAEGDPCTIVGAPGECREGACEPLVCGDGRATGAEACDGDDLGGATCASLGFSGETTGVRCNELCRLETSGCTGICGDGVRDGSELCDGANPDGVTCADVGFYREVTPGPLTCNGLCGWTTSGCADYCGDGITNGPELCDGAPPVETCVDLGLDAGRSGCSGICGAALDTCARFGFRPTFITAQPLNAFSASGTREQWVVGEDGFSARLSATGGWTPVPTPVTTSLFDVWSVSPTRAWAIGFAGTAGAAPPLLRFEAGAWQLIPDAPLVTLRAVWGLDDRAVIGTSDGVYAWSAAGWQRLGTLAGVVNDVAGVSATDLYAATPTGVHHWDGTAWTLGTSAVVVALSANRSSEVYGVGRTGGVNTPQILATWDGAAWSTRPLPTDSPSTALGVTASAPNDVWVALSVGRLAHFDGQRWVTTMRVTSGNTTALLGMRSLGLDEVVGGTRDGVAYRFGGQIMGTPSLLAADGVLDVWTDGAGAVFAVTGQGEVYAERRGAFPSTQLASPTTQLRAVWGSSDSDVWVGGDDLAVYHFDGATWTQVVIGTGITDVSDIVGSSATDVRIFGRAAMFHFDGAAWTTTAAPGGVAFGVAAQLAGELWVASLDNGLFRWDGAAFVKMHTTQGGVRAISIVSPTDIYVATNAGLEHFDGTTWASVSGFTSQVRDVSSSAADDVFVVADDRLYHFDGRGWLPVRVGDSSGGTLQFVRVHPNLVELMLPGFLALNRRSLLRTRPWNCRATETGCTDGVDDDCDGALDALDSDCP